MSTLFEVLQDPVSSAPDASCTPVRVAAPPPTRTPFQRRRRPRAPGAPQKAQKVYKPKYAGIDWHPKDGQELYEPFRLDMNPFSLDESPLTRKTTEHDYNQIHRAHATRYEWVYRQNEAGFMS